MNKNILFDDEARQAMVRGINKVADAVKITLGPRGRNVVLDNNPYAAPYIVNDGITIAREIFLEDAQENAGAKFIKEAASKANDASGDGSTTTTVLMQAIVGEAMKALSAGADAVSLRAGIEAAAKAVVESVKAEAVKSTDLESLVNIATISCGDETLGKLIAETIDRVGQEGIVTLEDSASADTTVEVSEGLTLKGALASPFFVTNRALQEAVLNDAPVLVTDQTISNPYEVVRIMEVCANGGHKAAFVVCGGMEGTALLTCIQNQAQGKFNLIPVKVTTFGVQGENMLRDVCAATTATLITPKDGKAIIDGAGNPQIAATDFGMADKIIATLNDITFLGGHGDSESRVEELKAQLAKVPTEFEKEGIKERIAKLQSGVGVIKVGGITDAERAERKLRVEDAINATKAAVEDGVVAGGGAPLYRASLAAGQLGDIGLGQGAVLRACQAPLFQMAANSSIELDKSELNAVADDKTKTVDFKNGGIVIAQEAGIIDPAAVVVAAIENAASSAALFVTSGALVTALPDVSTEKV